MGVKKKIGTNAILNVIKTGLSVLFPLITYPYAIRVLSPAGIGKVAYGSSIINYFALLAMLGISTYATREGAKRRDNRQGFNDFANEVFTINVIATVIAYALLFLALIFVRPWHDYRKLMLIQSASILLTTLGIDWVNNVFEDFLYITIRSILSHIVNIALLFILVRTADDYYMYALLTVLTNGFTCVLNWFYCRRYVHIRLVRRINLKDHFGPIIVLFANAIAVSIYVNLDVTMLGWMIGDYIVGLYEVSVKVYSIIKRLLAAIYTVSLPRLAYCLGNKDYSEYKKINTGLWRYLSILLIPCSVGLIAIAPEIMLFMGGSEMLEATLSLQILSGALIFAIFGGLTSMCINVTIGREKDVLVATIIGAAVNVGLNAVLIPLWKQNAAALTTMIAELVVFIVCFLRVPDKKRYVDFKMVGNSITHGVIASIPIIATSVLTSHLMEEGLLRAVVVVIGSVLAYGAVLTILKDDIFRNLINTVGKKLKLKR